MYKRHNNSPITLLPPLTPRMCVYAIPFLDHPSPQMAHNSSPRQNQSQTTDLMLTIEQNVFFKLKSMDCHFRLCLHLHEHIFCLQLTYTKSMERSRIPRVFNTGYSPIVNLFRTKFGTNLFPTTFSRSFYAFEVLDGHLASKVRRQSRVARRWEAV